MTDYGLDDDWGWLGRTRFGSGIARAIAEHIAGHAGHSQTVELKYPDLARKLEFTDEQLRSAVARLVRHGHARIDPVSPNDWPGWSEGTEYVLVLLSPGQLRREAHERMVAEEKARVREERRQAKIAARGGQVNRRTIPDIIKARVYARDSFACKKCGATDNLTIDHIHPWSIGGSDNIDNLQALCRPCNSSKGDRI